jgi:hypothetical protein
VVIFATPDFGAGAGVALIVLLAWAATVVLVAGGVILGARLLSSKSLIIRRGGLILLLASLSVPLFCYLLLANRLQIRLPRDYLPDHRVRKPLLVLRDRRIAVFADFAQIFLRQLVLLGGDLHRIVLTGTRSRGLGCETNYLERRITPANVHIRDETASAERSAPHPNGLLMPSWRFR